MLNTSLTICLVLFGCLINKVICRIQPIADAEDKVQQSVVQCVLTISEQEFLKGDSISIDASNHQADMLNLLQKKHKWTMYMQKVAQIAVNSVENRMKTDNYIIHLHCIEDLKKILMFLQIHPSWNPLARFIVTTGNTEVSAANITEIMWMYRILNVVIVLPSSADFLDMYSWYPYADGNCADNFTNIYVVNQCRDGELVNAGVSLFPDKIPKDLNGCQIRARPIGVPPFVILPQNLDRTKSNLNLSEGIEIKLLNTLAAAANFRVNYTLSPKEFDWGTLAENGTTVESSGLMKSLLDAEVDIGMGCVGSTSIRYKYLDYTVQIMQDSFAWCVPHALLVPKWKCLFSIFQLSTWILTLVTLLLASLCQWALSYNRSLEFPSYKDVQSCSSNIFSSMLGISVATQPRTGYNRMFFIIWIVFSMHLTISYQSSLISVLTRPSYEKQISSLDEMFDSKISFGFVAQAIRYYESQDDWRSRKVYREWRVCREASTCLKAVADSRTYAFGHFRLALRYNEVNLVDTDGKPLIYIFRDDIVVFSVIMQLSRGFPLMIRMNNLIYRIKEAGLLTFWFEQILYKKTKINVSTSSALEQKLNLFNVQGAFVILGCGLILATVVFSFELVIHKWRQTRV